MGSSRAIGAGMKKQRNDHLWERDPDDFYVEPLWCAQRLLEIEQFNTDQFGHVLRAREYTMVADPACGTGRILEAAWMAGYNVRGSDLVKRPGWADRHPERFQTSDFLACSSQSRPHWIVSNPPFKHCSMRYPSDPAPPFVQRALYIARDGVALLLPLTWIAGQTRSRWLATAGLFKVLVLVPRPSMPPGAVILAGERPGGGEEDFAWFVFRKGHTGPWIGGWCDANGTDTIRVEATADVEVA